MSRLSPKCLAERGLRIALSFFLRPIMPVLFTERTTPGRDLTATTAKVYPSPAASKLAYAAEAYVRLGNLFGLPSLTGLSAEVYLWNTLGMECAGLVGQVIVSAMSISNGFDDPVAKTTRTASKPERCSSSFFSPGLTSN